MLNIKGNKMKICFKCQRELPLSDFYKHKQMADGHLNKCKQCAKSDATGHRWDNIEKVREYDRARGSRMPEGYLKELRERKPNQYKAQNMVSNAVRDKKLFRKTCENCGSDKSIEGQIGRAHV